MRTVPASVRNRVHDRASDRARNRVRHLANALANDFGHLLDLERVRDCGRTDDFQLALDRTRDLERDLEPALERDRTLDFADHLNLAILDPNVAILDRNRATLERDVANVLAKLCVGARDLQHDRTLALDRDLDRASEGARERVQAYNRASDLADTVNLVRVRASNRAVQGRRRTVEMAPLAARLVAAAARLLPAGDRARYAEEFRSELAEIARSGAGRRPQLVYAVRQVISARRLRADLRAPRRRRAAP
jgi:hypothetical protein